MKKVIIYSLSILLVSFITACGLFKPGCRCPKFSQQQLKKLDAVAKR